jgi:uncharacterized protein
VKWVIRLSIILLVLVPLSRFLFAGHWLWYWVTDGILLVTFISGLIWFYNEVFLSLHKSKMAVAKSDPLKEIGLEYEEISLSSPGGHPILGWYIKCSKPSKGHPILIYSHGFGLSREQLGEASYRQFAFFVKNGYSIITLDYPMGQREGAHLVTGGNLESQDLSAVVKFAKEKGHQFIVNIGYSYGGNTALYYSINEIKPEVDAMILDSSTVFIPEVFTRQLKGWIGIPKWISWILLRLMWKRQIGYHWRIHPIRSVFIKEIKIPILFWHGTADKDAFYEVIEKVYTRQSNTLTELKTVEGGQHVDLHKVIGEDAYNQTTLDWLNGIRNYSI